jgi:LmbE family N-acetylglucosaminyl deacetylase
LELCEETNTSINAIMSEPDIIFTHTPKDTHPDHEIISKLVDIWSRNKKTSIFHFYTGGNTDWHTDSSNPNLFIDISGFEKDKKKLIKQYKKYPKNNPLNYKKIKTKDSYYGSLIGVDLAEIFEIKRIIID